MNVIYSNWRIHKLDETRVQKLSSRNDLLGDFLEKKNIENMDFDKLKAISKMWTKRIIDEIYNILNKSWDNNVFNWIKNYLEEINSDIEKLQNLNQKDFLLWYWELNKKVKDLLQNLENQKNQLNPVKNKQEIQIINNVIWKFKKLAKNIWNIILIWCTTFALSCSNLEEKKWSELENLENTKITSIQKTTIEEVDKVVLKLATNLEDSQDYRWLFKLIKNNPEYIRLIPKFDKKIQDLVFQLKNNGLFSWDNYVRWQTWKTWNKEIVKILFPTTKDISQKEEEIVIKALQKTFSLWSSEWKFWPKSKELFLKTINFQTSVSLETILVNYDEVKENSSNLLNNVRQVSIDEFEKYLFSLEWKKYKKWKTDCSWIFFITFNKLDILKDVELTFEEEWSTTIIKKLTQTQKELEEIERWDLIYWESSRYSWAKHIVYVSKVEEDWVWIFDSSVDTWIIKKRFLPWKILSRKKWLIAWTPLFLAEI